MTPAQAIDFARKIIALVLDLVPAPVARQLIDDAAVRRANAIADLAEETKFVTLPNIADLHDKDEDP